jgi:hypothetical protein
MPSRAAAAENTKAGGRVPSEPSGAPRALQAGGNEAARARHRSLSPPDRLRPVRSGSIRVEAAPQPHLARRQSLSADDPPPASSHARRSRSDLVECMRSIATAAAAGRHEETPYVVMYQRRTAFMVAVGPRFDSR